MRRDMAACTAGDLRLDAEVALAFTEIAHHRPHWIVDLVDLLTEKHGGAHALDITPGIE